jgi:hypothetical protein
MDIKVYRFYLISNRIKKLTYPRPNINDFMAVLS